MSQDRSHSIPDTKLRVPAWLYIVTPFIWMGVIYYFSDQPNSNEVTKHYFGGINYWVRKAAHVSEFAILYILCHKAISTALKNGSKSRASGSRLVSGIALGMTIAYAALDELHQTFVFRRSGSPYDVLIDAIGPMLVILFATKWTKSTALNPDSDSDSDSIN